MPDISIVVPVRNEAGNIAPLVGEIARAFSGRDFEIVYVNDGSSDGTEAELKSLAAEHQVLCISHLPQVAALADTQYVVTKEFTKDRTVSHLEKVEGKARVEEIARMLGGKGDSALAHAKTLLGQT